MTDSCAPTSTSVRDLLNSAVINCSSTVSSSLSISFAVGLGAVLINVSKKFAVHHCVFTRIDSWSNLACHSFALWTEALLKSAPSNLASSLVLCQPDLILSVPRPKGLHRSISLWTSVPLSDALVTLTREVIQAAYPGSSRNYFRVDPLVRHKVSAGSIRRFYAVTVHCPFLSHRFLKVKRRYLVFSTLRPYQRR